MSGRWMALGRSVWRCHWVRKHMPVFSLRPCCTLKNRVLIFVLNIDSILRWKPTTGSFQSPRQVPTQIHTDRGSPGVSQWCTTVLLIPVLQYVYFMQYANFLYTQNTKKYCICWIYSQRLLVLSFYYILLKYLLKFHFFIYIFSFYFL